MREILLPTGTDPLILSFWFRFVDNLPDSQIRVYPNNIGHGLALKKMVEDSEADTIMLMEEDSYVLDKEFVEKCFSMIEDEDYQIVGSPRMSCSLKLARIMERRYNLDYTGEGNKGPGFFPCFFFADVETLKETDMYFAPMGWERGERVPILDIYAPEDLSFDTMGWVALQLHEAGVKIHTIPQYHRPPLDMSHWHKKEDIWSISNLPWIHMGSLSGDIPSVIPDDPVSRDEYAFRTFFLNLIHGQITDKERFQAYEAILGEKIHL